jgi:hypothetical protein
MARLFAATVAVLLIPAAALLASVTAQAGLATHGRDAHATASAKSFGPFGDWPPGYWYGTDSWPMTIKGSSPPYQTPALGGYYGGYIGMTGNWAQWLGCNGRVAWSSSNSADANADFDHGDIGIGTGVYWFMGGPGVDPHYNGTTSEAYTWGEDQAAKALSDMSGETVTYPVVFMDVELPGIAPAPDNGWNSVYTSPCSGQVKISYVSPALDRADFDGFAAYLTSHSSYKAGVYSSPSIWDSIFGTGSYGEITNTYEWTYAGDTSSLSHVPDGWCLRSTSTCADFYGGITSSSPYALMWQWTGGGGTYNGYGDFDQIDKSRTPS